MHSRYLNNPDYTFEKVNRASMACGPMVKWAIAQVLILILILFYLNLFSNCTSKFNIDILYSRLVMRMY